MLVWSDTVCRRTWQPDRQ